MKLIDVTKNTLRFLFVFLLASIFSSSMYGCDQKTESKPAKTASTSSKIILPAKQTPSKAKQCPWVRQTGNVCEGNGVVLSYTKAGSYTIIEAKNKEKNFWIATPQVKINVGDKITYRKAHVMKNFHSKSLDKTFDEIIFTNSVLINGQQPLFVHTPAGMSGMNMPGLKNPHTCTASRAAKPIVVEPGSIKKVQHGYTIEELFAKKKQLNGQTVKVRAKVVKYFPGIMGKNWIHIQDGTGTKESNDVTITTQQAVQPGNIIVATGNLVINKDIGYGHVFPLLIEDANVVVEK